MDSTAESTRMTIERSMKGLNDINSAFGRAKEVSNDFLMKIIRDNQNTEYCRNLHFDQIKNADDFKRMVPLTVFDDYAEYVYREITNGEKDLMSVYGVYQYNRSSGTMGNPKKIPMSKISMDNFLTYAHTMPYAYAVRRFGADAVKGKSLSVMEASARDTVAGKRYCGVSAQTVIEWNCNHPELYTSPLEATCPDKDTDSRYLHARYGLAEKEIMSIQTTFITFVLDLFHYMENKWEMLCDDIEKGTIDPSVKMTPEVRRKLESELVPMPERANELRRIFSEGFGPGLAKKLWPSILMISGVCTGPFSAYVKTLKERFVGDIPFFMTGICASEGAFTIPVDFDSSKFIPLINTIFFEFLPLDEEDQTKTYTVDDVPDGDYEMIITTMSGLYRYRTRDAVRIEGRHEGLPLISYLYRIDMCINLNGEKTYEPALRKAMQLTADELGFRFTDYCVQPDTDVTPSRYHFFIEFADRPKGLTCNAISKILQKNLCVANPLLTYKFERELCGPVFTEPLQEETFALYRDKQIMLGGASTQVKPVKIIMNEVQLRFFKVLVDKE